MNRTEVEENCKMSCEMWALMGNQEWEGRISTDSREGRLPGKQKDSTRRCRGNVGNLLGLHSGKKNLCIHPFMFIMSLTGHMKWYLIISITEQRSIIKMKIDSTC